MVMVGVDVSSLLLDSQTSETMSFGLVSGLSSIWRSVCSHQVNRVNSRDGLAMITAQ